MVVPRFPKLVLLTVTLFGFLVSSCSLFGVPDEPMDILREHVRNTVDDPDRTAEMLVIVDRLDQLLLDNAQLVADTLKKERLLFGDYDSTPQDHEALFSDASLKRDSLREAMLHAHLEFKETATAEEWDEILPVHTRAIQLRVELLVADAIAERG